MTGYNMPDGLSEQSPSAPWNQPDPWVGKKCVQCVNAKICDMLDGSKTLVCAVPSEDKAREVYGFDAACELFAEF